MVFGLAVIAPSQLLHPRSVGHVHAIHFQPSITVYNFNVRILVVSLSLPFLRTN